MDLKLNSNYFGKNKARNGGALYFGKEQKANTIYENKEIIIENNQFYENYAQMFGGAIYSEYTDIYLAKTKDNIVSYNTAGIMGAGIYLSDPFDNKMINIKGFKFENNTVNSAIDNYTTKPVYISLNTTLSSNSKKINMGDYLPLTIALRDEYGNVIMDITKHYSMIGVKLKIKLQSNDSKNKTNNNIDNYYLSGNVCTFINGKNMHLSNNT